MPYLALKNEQLLQANATREESFTVPGASKVCWAPRHVHYAKCAAVKITTTTIGVLINIDEKLQH
jgi:hypothetical protein